MNLYFLTRERGKTRRRECPTCDEKRGKGKKEMVHRPLDEKWTRKPVLGPCGHVTTCYNMLQHVIKKVGNNDIKD